MSTQTPRSCFQNPTLLRNEPENLRKVAHFADGTRGTKHKPVSRCCKEGNGNEGGESMGKGEGHTKAKLRTTEGTEVMVIFGYTPQNRNNE